MRVLGYILALLIAAGAITWYAIGPQWRTFLSNPPLDDRVLQWTQSQRDSGFALSDKLPIINSVRIETNDNIRALPDGEPLKIELDVDAFVSSQNSAAVVVVHNGRVRLEKYGLYQDRDKRWTSFSVAKSFTSTLVGAAVKDGHIKSLDDKVSDYVKALKGSAYDDVSIHQLLTMTSGVRWNEDYQDPRSDVALFNETEPDPGETALLSYLKRLERAHPAGTVFNYSTGETNLVGVLVASATGKSLADYLSEKIWKPYGMQQFATWVTSKSGEEISGCCIQAAALDYARFGQFMLDGGVAGGQAVLPDGWIEEATRTQVKVGREGVRDYGYQWWTLAEGAYMAGGIFGQAIFIDPARQLVVVTHSSWDDATGVSANQTAERYKFFEAVQKAVDAE
ncbi:MAG: serine hydrolase [Pseudomonadota bacterium]